MKVLNFGSLNVDHVYAVPHFVRPGETLASSSYACFCGGKGLNQSIALALAGADVYHAGKLGQNALWLRDRLASAGVKTDYLTISDDPNGHAIIQVNPEGQNSIILYGGANRRISRSDVEPVFSNFEEGDYLLLQNEISAIPDIMNLGARRGMRIVFNPAPMGPEVAGYPLHLVHCFVLNEVEAADMTGEVHPSRILAAMHSRFPRCQVVLTLGEQGAIWSEGAQQINVPALQVKAIDTTAAGDTFIGYLLAGLAAGRDIEFCMRMACRAAALCVTRRGASDSIPCRAEVEDLTS